MTILALCSDGYEGRGGIAQCARDVLRAACAWRRGGRTIAVALHGTPRGGPALDGLEYRGSSCGSKVRFARDAITAAHSLSTADLVLCLHLGLLPVASVVAAQLRAPIAVWLHGIEAWRRTTKVLVGRALTRVRAFAAVSDLTRTRFTQWSGAQRRVWATLPNAIHLEAYAPGAAPAHLLDRYGLRGRKILLTVGRMSARERYKGFDQILECLPHLSREDLDIAYVAAGDGDDRGRLMEKTRQLALQDRVVFPGFVAEEEKQDHFRLADAFVMPGWGEGFGFVYLEALACGIPCLGSRIDGSREALRGGQLGILVDPRDPREVRNGLLRVLSMPRGTVPPGLEYFAYPRFQERVHAFFEAAAG